MAKFDIVDLSPKKAARAVAKAATAAVSNGVTPAKGKTHVWQSDADGLWYWHLLSGNGKIICGGLEGYTRKGHCRTMMKKTLSGAYADVPEEAV